MSFRVAWPKVLLLVSLGDLFGSLRLLFCCYLFGSFTLLILVRIVMFFTILQEEVLCKFSKTSESYKIWVDVRTGRGEKA